MAGRGEKIQWSRWVGVGITVLLVVLAFAVQWGVVVTKLGHVEKRLDALITETQSLRTEYADINRRVSLLEGAAQRE